VIEDYKTFISLVWAHQPTIILLIVGFVFALIFAVIDTHVYHKKKHKHRNKSHHNW